MNAGQSIPQWAIMFDDSEWYSAEDNTAFKSKYILRIESIMKYKFFVIFANQADMVAWKFKYCDVLEDIRNRKMKIIVLNRIINTQIKKNGATFVDKGEE